MNFRFKREFTWPHLLRILNGSAGISEMDLRLSQAPGTTPGFWIRMQAERDISEARKSLRAKVRKIIPNTARVSKAA